MTATPSQKSEIPPAWFVEPLRKLQERCYQHTMVREPFELVVDTEFGLQLGIPPGEFMKIAGPSGYITVRSLNRAPRVSRGVEELYAYRDALKRLK